MADLLLLQLCSEIARLCRRISDSELTIISIQCVEHEDSGAHSSTA